MADVPTDTGRFRHGNDTGNGQKELPDIGHSIRPGVPVPETVLVAVMSDGSYRLVGYPQSEPAAFVVRDDAGSLRQALRAAFGRSTGGRAGRRARASRSRQGVRSPATGCAARPNVEIAGMRLMEA